jgi:uncharacterized repeat protein (TIGR01451 family)
VRPLSIIAVLALASSAFAQQPPRDFTLRFAKAGPAYAGGFFVNAPVVESNLWTIDPPAFVVKVTVPPEIEITSVCEGNTSWDPSTRVFTWSDVYDNFKSCPMTFRVPATVPAGTTFALSGTISSTADTNPSNNQATSTYVVLGVSNLELKSTADRTKLRPGETLTYTFTVINHGPIDATSVVLVDQFSPYVEFISFEMIDGPPAVVDLSPYHADPPCVAPRCGTWVQANIGVLGAGQIATFRLVVRVKSSFEAKMIENRASIEAIALDLNPDDNRKDLFVFTGPNADLAIVGNRGLETESGMPVTFEIRNDGPDPVVGVTVHNFIEGRDGHYDFLERVRFVKATPSQGTCGEPHVITLIGSPFPPPILGLDCALGTMAPGAKATISVVIARSPGGGRFDYSAVVSPDYNDPNPANNRILLGVNLRPRNRAVKR